MDDSVDDNVFEDASNRFVSWLHQKGVTISPKIQLVDLRHIHAGRGVIANAFIDEDEELFTIPRSAILTFETSGLSSEIDSAPTDPWLSLILAMIYEYQRGSESTWRPYFDVLPTHFDTLMYWSEPELKLLQGSSVLEKIGKTKADEIFQTTIVPIIRQHEDKFKATHLGDDELVASCHRMGSTIMAYAFDLENTNESSKTAEDGWEEDSETEEILPKGMVPFADMLNADADRNNAKLFYEDDKVVMKTILPVQKGEELFNDYGPLPRADVLRRYGYITDNYANYDLVEVSLDLIKTVAHEESHLSASEVEARLEYLDEQDAADSAYDISRASAEEEQFPPELSILLNALTLPQAEFDRLKSKDKIPKPDLTLEALTLLRRILDRRLANYPESDAQEEQTINNELNGSSIASKTAFRRRMAERVIAGEKEVIREAMSTVSGLVSDRKRKADVLETDDTPSGQSKKKK